MKFKVITVCLVLLAGTASVYARQSRDVRQASDEKEPQKIERTVAADPGVTVSVCVTSGNILVRGWDKDEVKATSNAAEIELRRKDLLQMGRASKLDVFLVDGGESQRIRDKCQAYSDLELSVPRTASVRVQTRDGNISIIDVSMAFAGTQNGDISVAKISHAVEVGSVGGSISVKDSTGRTSITSIGGAIEAINVRPAAAADLFEAISVTGDLLLDRISHAVLNARTVTGNVRMAGPLAQQGRYEFKTLSGDVILTLPVNASFNLNAKLAQDGEIVTDFPLTLLTEDLVGPTPAPPAAPSRRTPSPTPASAPATPPTDVIVKVKPRAKVKVETVPVYTLKRYSAVCGEGGATIYVASFGGTLHLQKKD